MRAFFEELKAAVAGLGQAPGFAALAAGVLGLGLGAVIFMYGVADTPMLKPPPYPNAERLYTIVTHDGQKVGDYDNSMLPRDLLKVREAAGEKFDALGGIYIGTTYLTGDGQAERYDGAFADGHIFDVTGVAPELGRTILPRDTVEGAAPAYAIADVAVDHVPARIGLPAGRLRGNAHGYTAFFNECFIDEIAARHQREPLSFRIEMLGEDLRLAACLQQVAKMAEWGGGVDQSGQGLACHRIGSATFSSTKARRPSRATLPAPAWASSR